LFDNQEGGRTTINRRGGAIACRISINVSTKPGSSAKPEGRRPDMEVVPSRGQFIIRLGSVFVALTRDSAEEMLCLLANALEADDPLEIVSSSSN